MVNVVKGKKDGDTMDVSVSLMRSVPPANCGLPSTSEKGDGWLVSEVRG